MSYMLDIVDGECEMILRAITNLVKMMRLRDVVPSASALHRIRDAVVIVPSFISVK